MNLATSERRQQPRYDNQDALISSKISLNGDDIPHQCVDVSHSGLGILSAERLNIGQLIEIELSVQQLDLKLSGLICHRQLHGCHYRLGVQFTVCDAEQARFEAQLEQLDLALSA